MGRITLFTSDHCLFSLRVKHELEARSLPYTEINLTKFPDKRPGLFTFARSTTTPQAFFNTRLVGGYEKTLKQLKEWDKDKHFASPLEKYNAQIAKFPSPSNLHLAIPDEADAVDAPDADAEPVNQGNTIAPLTSSQRKTVELNLPSGVKTYTVWELTEELSSILPLSNLHYRLMTYKQSVTGTQATSAFMKHFCCTREQAEAIGKDLHTVGLLHHVTYDHDFKDSSKFYYRLQCHQTTHILNSLYLSDGEDAIGHDAVRADALVKRVKSIMRSITQSCLIQEEKKGGIQYKQAASHKLFGELQEALCCFQSVLIDQMEPKTLLAFGLNVYNVMLQFAFFKLGLPTKEANQKAFLQGIQFNVGGNSFSFQEWLGAISGGNVGIAPNLSDRSSLLVSKRPTVSPLPRSTLGTGTSTEGSESQSSVETPTGRKPVIMPQGGSPNVKRTTSSRTDSSLKSVVSDLSIADYRIYFATHFFWSRATAVAHFTPENLEKELDLMASAFCENEANVRVDEKRSELHLSNVFAMYRKDFCSASSGRSDSMSESYAATSVSDKDLAKIVFNFKEGPDKVRLQNLLSSGSNGKLKLCFHQDNWTTNVAKKEYIEFTPASIDANCTRF